MDDVRVLVWILFICVGVIIALYLAGRLFPKLTGKTYFKKLLWQSGIDWRLLPDACIQEFVADALRYAKRVSSTPKILGTQKYYFHIEFERMLKVHATGIAAISKGDNDVLWKDQEAVLRKHGIHLNPSRQ